MDWEKFNGWFDKKIYLVKVKFKGWFDKKNLSSKSEWVDWEKVNVIYSKSELNIISIDPSIKFFL